MDQAAGAKDAGDQPAPDRTTVDQTIEAAFNTQVARSLHREALRRAAHEQNTTSPPGLENMLARISAEATADAVARRSTEIAPDKAVS